MSTTPTLLVLGAGPKAVAVAAKARVLRELGLPAPRVVAVDNRGVAAHWLPGGGWTDGRHRLGTSPDKDVGYPYRSTMASGRNDEVNVRMLRYSWHSYLVGRGELAEWIDRGKPAPTHENWARYLRWAAVQADLEVVVGEVTAVDVDAHGWTLRCGGSGVQVVGDALMITGPGPSTQTLLPDHPGVLSVHDFWRLAADPVPMSARRAAVIGGGETAASIVDELMCHRAIGGVVVVSPNAALFTRGESYFENSLYSDPAQWPALPVDERLELIRRTDRGVFSVRVQESLLRDNRIQHLPGRVRYLAGAGDDVAVTIERAGRATVTQRFDLVVDATGGRPLWFADLFTRRAVNRLEAVGGQPCTVEGIQAGIGHDLALAGLVPKLFLPNLSGLRQGPGFPNLSCLGLLSDRVVGGLGMPESATNDTAHTWVS